MLPLLTNISATNTLNYSQFRKLQFCLIIASVRCLAVLAEHGQQQAPLRAFLSLVTVTTKQTTDRRREMAPLKPPPPAATTTLIRGGMNQLQQFFQKESARFASSPTLLLVNHFPPTLDKNSITTSQQMRIQVNAIQHVQYLLQQKLGYQTFIATCGNTSSTSTTAASYYPTAVDIDNAIKLSQRIGAYNIVAVGTGNVIDVGKALYNRQDSLFDELVLIPTTYGASMVSASSHSLLYDTSEDTLVPEPQSPNKAYQNRSVHTGVSKPRPRSILSIDDVDFDVTTSMFDTVTNRHITLLALLSIILDNIYQDITVPLHTTYSSTTPSSPVSVIPNEYIRIVDTIMSCLESYSPASRRTSSTASLSMTQEQHEQLINLCCAVGSYISYGLPVSGEEQEHVQPRSIPIAMVASLASKSSNITFSQYTAPTIMASFVLSYCELIIEKIKSKNQYTNTECTNNEKKLIQHLETIIQKQRDHNGGYEIPKIITTDSVMSLISTIQSNQMTWNCYSKSYMDDIDYHALFRHHLLL